MPSTALAPPQQSDQWAVGWAHNIRKHKLDLTVEAYYKTMSHLIEYKEGTSFFSGNDWQDKIEADGIGKAFGLEFMAQKKSGKSTGWISYTWSKNIRQFTNINQGRSYYYRYDRPHEINLIFNHELQKGFNLSASWVFKKGNPITIPSGKYKIDLVNPGIANINNYAVLHIYPGKNQFRIRDYHRLDISMEWKIKRYNREQTWSLGIINLYNRRNPSYYKITANKEGSLKLLQMTEFPIMPTISYSIRF